MADVEYRVDFTIQRCEPGDADFTEIGFGSSGSWSTLSECSHMVGSTIDSYTWETQDGMPDPEDVRAAVEGGSGT